MEKCSNYIFIHLLQYTDWENINDEYMNQKILGDLVGDYFFVCPTNIFANIFAERGGKVYYYFFTQVIVKQLYLSLYYNE